MVWHFPSRYEDFSQIYKVAELEPGQQATISGVVLKVDLRTSWKRKMTIVEAVIEDETGRVRAVWFNQPYLKNTLRVGRKMNFSGKVSASENDIYFSHPDYEGAANFAAERDLPSQILHNKTWEGKHTGRLVPIYPETKGLSSRALRFIIQPILKNLNQIPEFLPREILEEQNFPEINEAILKIHFPDSVEEVASIRRRFAFENIFLLQLFNLQQKLKLLKKEAPKISIDAEYLKNLLAALPFELTGAQKKSLSEVLGDLEKSEPMNRLLQGDVGSGKTIVAAIAAIGAARGGRQTAFMAPTEVLANQHFKTLKNLFSGIQERLGEELPSFGLLTASGARVVFSEGLTEDYPRAKIRSLIGGGEIKIVIGTHALIEKSVRFRNLGLVIIDEQHRFGVRQRQTLAAQTDASKEPGSLPHFLSMSATPIPRTLMLTIFGDLDISIIDEMPKGRKEIITKIVAPENRIRAYGFIKGQVLRGRQAFVICPRIEKTENQELGARNYEYYVKLDVKSVKEEYEKLSKKIFPDLRVGMLHGQMPARGGSASGGKASKEAVMEAFRKGEIDILVATSVIEVGIDVPNATIMMIEGSDRFGLAQLYQFRGRVGRGKHQSFCFLFTDSGSAATNRRQKAIVNAKNGFELAEEDLKIRGPGQFLGESQAGLPDVAMEALQDVSLIKSSRELAAQTIKKDQTLKKYPALREKLTEFREKIHTE